MKKTLIFGAGGFGREILSQIKDSHDVIGFLDNDEKRIGEFVDGVEILGNASITQKVEYDEVMLGTLAMSIVDQLVEAGVPREKINTEIISVRINARLNFIHDFASGFSSEFLSRCCVAEGGYCVGSLLKRLMLLFQNLSCIYLTRLKGLTIEMLKLKRKGVILYLPQGILPLQVRNL